MARRFTAEEEVAIRKSLLREARRRFGQVGLSKTSIDELTRAVGISKGAFYRFFDSKEDLYFTLIHEYEEGVRQEIRRLFAAATPDQSPEELLSRMLKKALAGVAQEPMLQSLLSGNEVSLLWRGGGEESRRHNVASDIAFVEELLPATAIDHAVASGMLRSLFFLFPHRQEIGVEEFDEVLERLVDAVVAAIFADTGERA